MHHRPTNSDRTIGKTKRGQENDRGWPVIASRSVRAPCRTAIHERARPGYWISSGRNVKGKQLLHRPWDREVDKVTCRSDTASPKDARRSPHPILPPDALLSRNGRHVHALGESLPDAPPRRSARLQRKGYRSPGRANRYR